MKSLTLAPSPRGLWLIYHHGLGHLRPCPSVPFLFLTTLWPGTRSVAVFLAASPQMNSLPNLSLKLHLKRSFLPSACITFHTSLLSGLPCLLGWPWRRLIALGSGILFCRAPLWILYYIVPPGHTGPPPEHALSSFPVTLTVPVPMTSQTESSTILTIPSSFATKELLNSAFWEHTWIVLPESNIKPLPWEVLF